MIASATAFAISCDKDNEPDQTPPTEQPENPQEPEQPEEPQEPENPQEPTEPEEPEEPDDPKEPEDPKIEYTLNVSPESFTEIPAEGATMNMSITSNASWNIVIEYTGDVQNWVELSIASGNDNADISITALPNDVEAIREAVIVVSLVNVDTTCTVSVPVSQLAGKPLKTYKVGQKYSKNGKEGLVFYITDEGRHGKIVSDASIEEMYWSTENSVTGATDMDYGMNNMKIIQEIEGWEEKFPAFAWCAELGEGWYLPAQNELNAIDRTGILPELFNEYWSSTEYSDERAYAKSFYTAEEFQYRKCKMQLYVRAVCEF